MLVLNIYLKGDGEQRAVELTEKSYTLGRSRICDIPIPHQYLSRQHSKLEYREGQWWLMDLGSKNGTFVNDRRIAEPTPVKAGDRLRIADVEAELEERAAPPPSDGSDFSSLGNSVILDARRFLDQLQSGSSSADATPNERRLHLVNEVHAAVLDISDLRGLGRLLLDKLVSLLDPDEAVVTRYHGDKLESLAEYPGGSSTLQLSESLMRQIYEDRQAVLHQQMVGGREDSEAFNAGQSLIVAGVWSLVAAPILDGDKVLGMIALARSREGFQGFQEDDLELLTTLSSVAALRIRNLEYLQAAEQQRLLEQEIAIARDVQRSLLPDILPEFPEYDLVAQNYPSRGVSGDLYQVFERGDEVSLLVIDVSGKGVPAAILTATVEALASGLIEAGQSTLDVASQLGQQLFRRTPAERYATGVLARLDRRTHRVELVSAGHNPSLIVRADGSCETVDSTGMPWGLVDGAEYASFSIALDRGDTLVFYSDGITEAINPEDEEYGVERLIEVCRNNRERGLGELVAAVSRDLDDFARGVAYHDDRTLLVIRRLPLDQVETAG